MLFAALLTVAPPALAEEVPPQQSAQPDAMITADPDQIARILTGEGYRAKVETDEKGQRHIKSASSGRNFTVYFFGCGGGVKLSACSSIEFYTGFTTGKPYPVERTNAWNADNRYGRAYVDSEKDPVVEMDLYLDDGGMPRAQFVENLQIWTDVMANFDGFVFDDDAAKKKK